MSLSPEKSAAQLRADLMDARDSAAKALSQLHSQLPSQLPSQLHSQLPSQLHSQLVQV